MDGRQRGGTERRHGTGDTQGSGRRDRQLRQIVRKNRIEKDSRVRCTEMDRHTDKWKVGHKQICTQTKRHIDGQPQEESKGEGDVNGKQIERDSLHVMP